MRVLIKNTYRLLINFTFLISCVVFSQNPEQNFKIITGKVYSLNSPIPNVNISLQGLNSGTKTDAEGKYTIEARVNDVLIFSHVSYKTVKIVIEDITNILNVELSISINELDKTVITKRKPVSKVLERFEKKNKEFKSAFGLINPKKSGFSIGYIDAKDLNESSLSLSEALNGKLAGVRIVYNPIEKTRRLILKGDRSINNVPPPLWDVDGQILSEEPPINITDVKDIHILKTTNMYGSAGAGGVIVVRTKYGSLEAQEVKKQQIAAQYYNEDYYANDALSVPESQTYTNPYTHTLREINNTAQAFLYYQNTIQPTLKDYATHMSIAQNFIQLYKDNTTAKSILKEQVEIYKTNPEILKAIAYHYQSLGFKRESINTYQTIFKLRPSYAQSYRDLANAYVENDQYKEAWRLYMRYLLQGHDVSQAGIGELLYNEMEWLYFNRNTQTDIKQEFVPKNETITAFRNDVRLVFEWNTSEAEFDLEFVGPEKRAYTFAHTLADNQDLITTEKQKGYSSKEFIIDAIGDDEWLVNLSYQGNKKPEPTFFKVTIYYHWGKPTQRQEIQVYQLQNQKEKVQLLKLNRQLLIAKN